MREELVASQITNLSQVIFFPRVIGVPGYWTQISHRFNDIYFIVTEKIIKTITIINYLIPELYFLVVAWKYRRTQII